MLLLYVREVRWICRPFRQHGETGSLMAAVNYHATYLFVYNFSYGVIMSVHDSALITYFWWYFRVFKIICEIILAVWYCHLSNSFSTLKVRVDIELSAFLILDVFVSCPNTLHCRARHWRWPDACFKAVGPVRATGFKILLARWASGFNPLLTTVDVSIIQPITEK